MLCLSPITQCTEDKLATLIFPVYFEVAFIYLPFVIMSHTHTNNVLLWQMANCPRQFKKVRAPIIYCTLGDLHRY